MVALSRSITLTFQACTKDTGRWGPKPSTGNSFQMAAIPINTFGLDDELFKTLPGRHLRKLDNRSDTADPTTRRLADHYPDALPNFAACPAALLVSTRRGSRRAIATI